MSTKIHTALRNRENTMNTTATMALALTASIASAQNSNPDLIFTSLEIVSVELIDNLFEIGFAYEITNVGAGAIDLAGPDLFDDLDNIGFQTYLASDEELLNPIFASGGWLIPTQLGKEYILETNDTYSGMLFANTGQLTDPTMLDPFNWLVVDILTDHSAPEEMGRNNRAVIHIPAPGAPTLLAIGCMVATVRRR